MMQLHKFSASVTRDVKHGPDPAPFLHALGLGGDFVDYGAGQTIYSQGDPSDTVLYIQHGRVKLSVISEAGKEAVVGMCGSGEFFGEGALAQQPIRLATASTMVATRIRVVPTQGMARLLHEERALSDRFIAHLLARNTRLEEALLDQLFNACEKRLARTLLLLASSGMPDGPQRVLPTISQEVLAEMVGTTRSRVNVFMNKFRKLGFIDYDNGGLRVHQALLSRVLHEAPASGR